MGNELTVEHKESWWVITLNRPESRNAVTKALADDMSDYLDAAMVDDTCRSIIITGAGDKAFCAGNDLAELARTGRTAINRRGRFAGIVDHPFDKPLIAAVNGDAIAGGFEIMLRCDLVVAVAGARFGLPEVRNGVMAGAGGLVVLPRFMPPQMAKWMVLTGELIDVYDAHSYGLVSHIEITLPEMMLRAEWLAQRIADNAPLSVSHSKAVMDVAINQGLEAAWARNMAANEVVFSSEDSREGALAFKQRRRPEWRNR